MCNSYLAAVAASALAVLIGKRGGEPPAELLVPVDS